VTLCRDTELIFHSFKKKKFLLFFFFLLRSLLQTVYVVAMAVKRLAGFLK